MLQEFNFGVEETHEKKNQIRQEEKKSLLCIFYVGGAPKWRHEFLIETAMTQQIGCDAS